MKRVGWTQPGYSGMGRVSPSVNLYPFIKPPTRRRPAANSYRPMGRVPRRRR